MRLTRGRSFALARAIALLIAPLHARAAAAQDRADGRRALFESIRWADGPTGKLGERASIGVPRHCRFTGAAGARTFLEVTRNPASGDELGLLFCRAPDAEVQSWFVVFSFDASGYVRDDDRTQLDADRILARMREGNAAGNEERRRRGWEPLTLEGWVTPPHYDAATNDLTWSTRVSVPSGGASVNHSVRLLGRRGVMHAELVADPGDVAAIVPAFDSIVRGHAFVAGERYSDWRAGDPVAGHGLTALVAGGADAAAARVGRFAALWTLALAVVSALALWRCLAGVRPMFSRRARAPGDGAA